MVSAQMSTLVALALIVAAFCCLARLASFQLLSKYPAFVIFLMSQVATTVLSYVTNVRTDGYAWFYLILLIAEWLAYGLMVQELYNSIFFEFPGIAVLGQWSFYGALLATVALFLFGIVAAQQKAIQLRTLVVDAEFVSHCLLLGFAAFLVLLLVAISRYPLRLHRNILANYSFFSFMLVGETCALILDQATSRRFTNGINLAMNGLGVICLVWWQMLLSRESLPENAPDYRPT